MGGNPRSSPSALLPGLGGPDEQSLQPLRPLFFPPQLQDLELRLFSTGRHWHAHCFLGAHSRTPDGIPGVRFAAWAPNGEHVSVMGDFYQLGRTRAPHAATGRFGRLRALHPRARCWRPLQVRDPRLPRWHPDKDRPLCQILPAAAADHRLHLWRKHIPLAGPGLDASPRCGRFGNTCPCSSTRSTWAPGAGAPKDSS